MNKVAIGLVFLALGLWGGVTWWWFLWDVIKGLVVMALFIAGLLLVGLGVKDIGATAPAKAADR